jgi:hypothetical protein
MLSWFAQTDAASADGFDLKYRPETVACRSTPFAREHWQWLGGLRIPTRFAPGFLWFFHIKHLWLFENSFTTAPQLNNARQLQLETRWYWGQFSGPSLRDQLLARK